MGGIGPQATSIPATFRSARRAVPLPEPCGSFAYALSRPYSIGVLAILLVLVGSLSARRLSTDILPTVDIPSVNLIWTYSGLNATEMASKISSFSEISVLNNVDDVLEVRSETTDGVAIVKIEFQPSVDIGLALSQVTSVSQTILRRMPPGTSPPLVVRSSQSSQPILNLVLSSQGLDDSALFDYARLQLRGQIQTIPGIRLSLPYGGAPRQVMVELDPRALQTFGLTAADVATAVSAQNLTLPSGPLREGTREFKVVLNASPTAVADFNELPVRQVEGRVVRLSDVASVRDGPAVQTNLARLNGVNAVQVSVLKLGGSSTVDIVDQILARMPEIRAAAPPGMTIEPLFDQSVFVRSAVRSVAYEGVLVGLLVATVVLVFIGSLRSTLIVLTSIPLALLGSVAGLFATGQTFNLMTLGGLALAIGILVDNALVEIENCNRRIAAGEPVREAIVNSAGEVVFPEFVSTLCICIVFLPIFLLTGVPAYVFTPMASAVVFAMIGSFVLSRTLVPTMAALLLPGELARREARGPNLVERGHHRVERRLDALRDRCVAVVEGLITRPWLVALGVACALAAGGVAAWSLERSFFPRTDAGLMRLHVRAPSDSRLEETARLFADVQRAIRSVIPADEIDVIAEVIGQPDPINLGWVDSTALGGFDGEIYVQLKPGHAPTAGYQAELRRRLAADFPTLVTFFRPADTTALTLAGSSPTDIDLRIVGRDGPGNRKAAQALLAQLKQTPGVEDVTMRQVFDVPQWRIEVDRTRALQLGLTQQQVASAVLGVLGSAGTVAPNFWADPVNGAAYSVQVIATPLSLDSLDTLMNTPVRLGPNGQTVLLRNVATVQLRQSPAAVTRVTLAPALNVLANLSTDDLGGVLAAIEPTLARLRAELKPGNRIELRGQGQTMNQAYADLASGLLLAVVLVFLVQAVNFQSWRLPLNAMAALPIALAGAALALRLTGTPLSVPALMGMIMVVGVSTANSVLITSFARDRLAEGIGRREAALAAARTRFRPVLMTATAMILGVLPMALGVGDGGEQNAPLGRAVIGGLLLGTVASLVLVPVLFARFARVPQRAPADPPIATGTLDPLPDSGNESPASMKTSVLPMAVATRRITLRCLLAGWIGAALLPSPAWAQAALTPRGAAEAQAGASAVPQVRIVQAEPVAGSFALRLPARLVAAEEARIFARATGIVVERRVDLGDRVKAGDLLLRISAPEVDQSLESARAALGQASARERLASLNLERSKPLVEQQFLSPSSLDTLSASLEVAKADSAAARSEVRRLEAIQRFQQVRAPFAGVITERTVERGDRVSGEGGDAAVQLFRLARLDDLRVVVDVPQSAALGLTSGTTAQVSFAEFPGESFQATVRRRSGAIDPATGTMRAELSLPNPQLRLPAGLRGEAVLESNAPGGVRVPAAALHMREGRPHVATVDATQRLRFVPVQVDRTSGRDVLIRSGLAAGTKVVTGLNALLREGDAVRVTP